MYDNRKNKLEIDKELRIYIEQSGSRIKYHLDMSDFSMSLGNNMPENDFNLVLNSAKNSYRPGFHKVFTSPVEVNETFKPLSPAEENRVFEALGLKK